MRALVLNVLFLLALSLNNSVVFAHSGRTDSAGGHNCRVGSCAGTYHYHNSGSSYTPPKSTYTPPAPVYIPPAPVYIPPTPTCGTNAYLDSNNDCYCKDGYITTLNNIDCVYLPTNAYEVTNGTDAWLCIVGYIEKNGSCIKEIIPPKVEITSVKGATTEESVQTTAPTSHITTTTTTTTVEDAEESTGSGWMTLLLGLGGGYWLRMKKTS